MQECQPEILGSAKLAVSRLKATFPAAEAEIIAKRLTEWVSGMPWHHIWTHPEEKYSPEQQLMLEEAIRRVLGHEPLQYIIGVCWFMGHPFKVTPAVLIPRPETEELVEWVKGSLGQVSSPHLIDIGTGSGNIAISLSLSFNKGLVHAIDISPAALEVAKENNLALGGRVQFRELDVFSAEIGAFANLDAIVSNPPYVLEDEKAQMEPNVLQFEPHLALFVPDRDPLLYYRQILKLGKDWLRPGGLVFFEINEGKGQALLDLGAGMGYKEGTLRKDMQKKDRMIRLRKPD